MPQLIARKLRIFGRVQGVGYRETLRREAERCGVGGWVRNCSDGTVEAHLQGEPEAVDRVVDWCRRGPPAARVSEIRSEEVSGDAAVSAFRVLVSG
jgi:acylphosphatase